MGRRCSVKSGSLVDGLVGRGRFERRRFMKPRVTRKPITDNAAERRTLLPGEETSGPEKGEKASPEKWEQIQQRAGELAMNEGKEEAKEEHLRRAKRELLGLQTLADPENPGEVK
jgi:hypothetical protein